MKSILAVALTLPSTAIAEAFDRPIPQPQTDTAEFWFFVGSIALILALVAVQMLVSRR
ncbi:hypothetical protein [Phaeobacter gallaeciensis]|uniref:Protein NnrT n=1 Tax=Phaeobacter gallaeciensis TaxID=60890 RepID=A0ABD4XDK6_9RHOB|nr:hypothetical protein [Phaeobacter gallaeciensis]MDF1772013.1 hypothetical protein [Pseudophaeobacter sp. bin_em_oilr2.035]MDE4140691.1 hypothetical protein [Phaeobacter gallaeciensis]MDE4146319.1 hypothetical protein [Phaeobacter gallaeciensis]MDE4149136.1 hypothetical protein [Phaeobacter gallaeciensis]MDE4153671.1 hypothetical protein [Phaeobacter gallaeciensis]